MGQEGKKHHPSMKENEDVSGTAKLRPVLSAQWMALDLYYKSAMLTDTAAFSLVTHVTNQDGVEARRRLSRL